MKTIKSWTLCLLFVGCTTVLKKLDIESQVPHSPPPAFEEQTFCSHPSTRSPQLVGSNPSAQRDFTEFLRRIEGLKLDFREKAVLWGLLQINIRPDVASPTARLQLLIKDKKGTNYQDYSAQEGASYPYLEGLSSLLKDHPRRRPLRWYAQLLDDQFKAELVAGKTLEQHLRLMKDAIADQEELRRHFFRGDEVLRESERLSRINFSRLITQWEKQRKSLTPNSTLYSYRRTPQLNVRCNYDFKLYDNSIFLIDKEENNGHLFGLTQGHESMLAVSAQLIQEPRPLFGEPVIVGSPRVRSSALCVIESGAHEVWVAANQSRDPGQHVYHLFRYGLTRVDNSEDILRLLRHARHMFLSDPLRLVIESSRGREEQVEELLKLNVPIYNARSIGNIWAWSDFSNEGGRFYIDDRNPGALFCAP
jgi:hypothetical protein